MPADPRTLFVNGRFLSGPATAVNAVAEALMRALAREAAGSWRVVCAVPPALQGAARATGLPLRVVGRGEGITWEQHHLPTLHREGVVAGFFNTVPLRGRGYVTLLHDAQVFDWPQSYPGPVRLWRRALARAAGRRGNLVLTVSDHARARLLAHGVGTAERVRVVPNGLGPVGSVLPDAQTLQRLGLMPRRYALAFAAPQPHKNLSLVLRLFGDPPAGLRLVLVGDAPAPVPPGTVVTGRMSEAGLAALYAGAAAVLVPSHDEGFGLPALEALALGAPVLASDRGALPEVLGGAGTLLPPDDPGAWRRALGEVMHQPRAERAARAARGRARARCFTWQASARAALSHLDAWRDA